MRRALLGVLQVEVRLAGGHRGGDNSLEGEGARGGKKPSSGPGSRERVKSLKRFACPSSRATSSVEESRVTATFEDLAKRRTPRPVARPHMLLVSRAAKPPRAAATVAMIGPMR